MRTLPKLPHMLIACVALMFSGCITLPGVSGEVFLKQPCHPHRHHQQPVIVIPSTMQVPNKEVSTVPLTVEPTEVLPKALRGVAELCCATDQFQLETLADAAESLDVNCYWPDVPENALGGDGNALPAPLMLVTYDPSLGLKLVEKKYPLLAEGEFFCQMALPENPAIVDHRDRFTDVANRHGKILREMLTLAQNSPNWFMTGYTVPGEIAKNDVAKYPFVDSENNPIRVRVFPNIIHWQG